MVDILNRVNDKHKFPNELISGDKLTIRAKHPKTGRYRKVKSTVQETNPDPQSPWMWDILLYTADGYYTKISHREDELLTLDPK